MTKTYRFTVDVTADEMDRLLDTEEVRLVIAQTIRDEFRPGQALKRDAPIIALRVDGRELDFGTGKLEETPINAEINDLIVKGQSIQAIKALRANDASLSLMGAKDLVDKWRANR